MFADPVSCDTKIYRVIENGLYVVAMCMDLSEANKICDYYSTLLRDCRVEPMVIGGSAKVIVSDLFVK